jgi:hypothetical protein
MQKKIYIVKGIPSEDYKNFEERIFSLANEVIAQLSPSSMRITLTLDPPPRLTIIPFSRDKTAALSVTGAKGRSDELITGTAGFTGSYAVEEAIPVAYHKTWEDGEPTPGICLLTLFKRKPGIDRDTFISRWHNGHTPLSLKLHPLWNYNRNVVVESSVKRHVTYEGIVEEQFRKTSDLLNPFRFFGPPLKVPLHMIQVYRDTRSFIDMKSIEIYLATEFHLKS